MPCFTEHAFQRAQERYGVTLTPSDMSEILAACLAGVAPMVRHNGITAVHVAMFKDTRLVVAVRRQCLIVTFLPPGADQIDPSLLNKPRGRGERRRQPYKRAKVRLCDLRRANIEDIHP